MGLNFHQSSSYELSDTFQQKQIEILERKYGGHYRAHRAATVIQRAFREHCLARKWKQMCNPSRRRLLRMRTLDLTSPTPSSLPEVQISHYVNEVKQNSVISNGKIKLHPYNLDKRSHLSAPLTAQLRLAAGGSPAAGQVSEAAPKRAVQPLARVIAKPRSLSAERHRNHRTTTAGSRCAGGSRVRVIPVVPVPVVPSSGAKTSILSHKSEILPDSRTQSPPKFILGRPVPYSLTSRKSDTSLLSQESQGSSNSGGSSNDSTGPNESPSYLTYSQVKNTNGGRSLALLPVIPRSGWTSGSDLDTPSSDTGSCTSYGALKSPRNGPTNRTGDRAVWVPRIEANRGREIRAARSQQSPVHVSSADNLLSARSVPETMNFCPSDSELTLKRDHGKMPGMRFIHRTSEMERKRQYRIALNFFNKKPDRGMQFLIEFGFVEANPRAVAKFLLSRRGLSKQMIGEYLGNLQNPFNSSVLEYFVSEVDLRGLEIDTALRKFQSHYRFPGEAQKIERIIEAFANHYCACNSESVRRFRHPDAVFMLSFAVIMLNTDLHSPNVKPERKMKLSDFLKNLNQSLDETLDQKMLAGIYQRVKEDEFRPGSDHVTQVMKVDKSIVGKKPVLSLPHRRLVCYCRLYEIDDPQKKQSPTVHQREIFLFNDILVVTKVLSRKKSGVTYSYRQSHSLVGMQVSPFRNQYYAHALKIHHTLENKVLLFNARSEDDKVKFLEDLKESIMESDQMEAVRIELELEKQSVIRPSLIRCDSQRDSGLPDIRDEGTLTKGARTISNSGLEFEGGLEVEENPKRSGSVNSLDSGMSSNASVGSREMSPKVGGEEKYGSCVYGVASKDGNGKRIHAVVQRNVVQSSTSSDV